MCHVNLTAAVVQFVVTVLRLKRLALYGILDCQAGGCGAFHGFLSDTLNLC
jgi:hypothetical protein